MGLWPTYWDESPFIRFIDFKQVTRDFRRSVTAWFRHLQLLRDVVGYRILVSIVHSEPPECLSGRISQGGSYVTQ
jgi:hypothetical protein